MVSLQQEEVPLSAEDAELPEMVPVSIRSTLPELQHCPLERVLAGLLLTWKEFLQLFDIRVEASDYFIRGSNGSKSDLNQKIGDYVSTFRRKLKIYPVTLERIAEVNEMAKGQRGTSLPEGSIANKIADNNRASGSGSGSKKLKLMDEDKRKRNQRKITKESLEKIVQSVIKERTVVQKKSSGKKGDGKRDANKSRSSTPPSTIKADTDGPTSSSGLNSLVTIQQAAKVQLTSGTKLKRLSTDHSQVKDIVPGGVVKRGRKPRTTRTLSSRTLSSRRSSAKLSINSTNTGVETNDEEDSSNSLDEDEEPETKDKNKRLKNHVVKYFQERLSPRTLLSLREELMGLREKEKYFKITSIVPMAAGLMEQTFCRKLTE